MPGRTLTRGCKECERKTSGVRASWVTNFHEGQEMRGWPWGELKYFILHPLVTSKRKGDVTFALAQLARVPTRWAHDKRLAEHDSVCF